MLSDPWNVLPEALQRWQMHSGLGTLPIRFCPRYTAKRKGRVLIQIHVIKTSGTQHKQNVRKVRKTRNIRYSCAPSSKWTCHPCLSYEPCSLSLSLHTHTHTHTKCPSQICVCVCVCVCVYARACARARARGCVNSSYEDKAFILYTAQ